MITLEDWAEIRRLHRAERMPIKAIVRHLGISRNTGREALRGDGCRRPDEHATTVRDELAGTTSSPAGRRLASTNEGRLEDPPSPRVAALGGHKWGTILGVTPHHPLDGVAGARHHDMTAQHNETPGQRPFSGAYLGLLGWHPQRDSNPCRHLERAVKAVHTMPDQGLR